MSISSVSGGSAGSAVGMHLITGGTNATPIVATFAANSGLKTGDRVAISGITGLTAMNGEWTLEAVTATTFKLLGSVGNGTYGGTPRCALLMDKTPLAQGHNALLTLGGNLVGTVLIESYGSYADFAAGNNGSLGYVDVPVPTSAMSIITNTAATPSSSSTISSSAVAMAAANEAVPLPLKLSRYMRFAVSAYTSGTVHALISA